MALDPEILRAVRRYGPRADSVARRYGLSGEALLAKLIQGESGGRGNAVSSAGARGWGQFMPQTRQAVLRHTGGQVDPWRSPDEAVQAAVIHLRGELGHRQGLEGYNPGGGQGYVQYILGQRVGDVGGGAGGLSSPRTASTSDTSAAPSTEPAAAPGGLDRRSLLLNYLDQRGDPNALLSLASGLQSVGASSVGTDPSVAAAGPQAPPGGPSAPGELGNIVREANRIDQAQVRYQWGGGHQARQIRGSKVTPLDCSGAVSRALGINPMVSGQFAKWGKAGEGRNVAIYANDTHVLMKVRVNGKWRFWGTSKTNPGGGAGWIDASAISPSYLRNFTVRHPPGM